jgi:hypothetical protein
MVQGRKREERTVWGLRTRRIPGESYGFWESDEEASVTGAWAPSGLAG